MSNEVLSQEEVDILLNGTIKKSPDNFGEEEKDLLGEIGNICMGSAATTLSTLIKQPVSITTPKVECTTLNKLKNSFDIPNVSIEVRFCEGIDGANLLLLNVHDAVIIADLMMGGEGKKDGNGLSEIELSAVSEAMNQMIGTAATSMSSMFNKVVNITPPQSSLWHDKTEKLSNYIDEDEEVVEVAFRIIVGSLIDSQIMLLLPIKTADEIVDAMDANYKASADKANQEEEAGHGRKDSQIGEPEQAKRDNQAIEPSHRIAAGTDYKAEREVSVQKARFMPLEKEQDMDVKSRNIDLIMDVPVEVSAILGRTKKNIGQILELGTGSLIELDNNLEEPVEVLVNGKLVAKGEIVVVNENFGVRINSIISNVDRVKGLSK